MSPVDNDGPQPTWCSKESTVCSGEESVPRAGERVVTDVSPALSWRRRGPSNLVLSGFEAIGRSLLRNRSPITSTVGYDVYFPSSILHGPLLDS